MICETDISRTTNSKNYAYFDVYNLEGECVFSTEINYDDAFPEGGGYPVAFVDENGVIKVYQSTSEETLLCLDHDFNVVDESAYKEQSGNPCGHEGWYYYEEQSNGLIFVGSEDKSQWGYLDGEGNVLSMYMDATAFTESGYALASNDLETYDLIDSELNVIAKGIVTGARVATNGNNYFTVTTLDGTMEFYIVE